MSIRWLLLLPLLIFIGLSFFLWRGLDINPQTLPSALIGKSVPQFSLPDLMNPSKSMTDQSLKNQTVLLNVWASWCISCRLEHPVLMDIVKNEKIPIVGLDYKDSKTNAIAWLTRFGNPYREIGFDQSGRVAINFGVYGTPETFIIDKNGIIRYKYIGPITEAVWKTELKPEIDKLNDMT